MKVFACCEACHLTCRACHGNGKCECICHTEIIEEEHDGEKKTTKKTKPKKTDTVYATVTLRVVVPRTALSVDIEEEVINRLDSFRYGAGRGVTHVGLLLDAYCSQARKDDA